MKRTYIDIKRTYIDTKCHPLIAIYRCYPIYGLYSIVKYGFFFKF